MGHDLTWVACAHPGRASILFLPEASSTTLMPSLHAECAPQKNVSGHADSYLTMKRLHDKATANGSHPLSKE
eukprot:1137141-Pelagomonas_calceolata.AAC.7